MPNTNGHGPRRAVLYARVSTDEQARSGYSLAQQIEALREYAAREGYEVLEEVSDPGQSGASLERPGMDRVRDLVAAGGVSVVLAQDRDRFAREPAYHYLLRKEFQERGTTLRALNDRGDDSPEGELTDGILDQLAKYERAKTSERTRRGKLRRAREGKIVPGNSPDYGFKYNAARDNYVVDEEEMSVVRRMFYLVGVERRTLYGAKRVLEDEGVRPRRGGKHWSNYFIRTRILDDVYKPHTYQEVEPRVTPEVAARLDPERLYGIWWYNRRRVKTDQASEVGPTGRQYRKRRKFTLKPEEKWIAVPVPDCGIPREWIDAAREAIKNNRRASSAGHHFWELSGGILRCGGCRRLMYTNSIRPSQGHHYYRCPSPKGECPVRKNYRADFLEPSVWGFVSGVLADPTRVRKGLDEMVERERHGVRGDPGREAKTWLDKLVEADRMRAGFQELAAKGLMTLEELGERLGQIEEARRIAQRELASLEGRQQRLEELEQNRETLLDYYAGMMPEALDELTGEERHHVYKMLKLEVATGPNGQIEVAGALGAVSNVCESEMTSASSLSTRVSGWQCTATPRSTPSETPCCASCGAWSR